MNPFGLMGSAYPEYAILVRNQQYINYELEAL